ncbi:uncharacterized protein TNCV_579781 [Trichonephila clavipes]|nr:uncharacterized protein TNCV_579781 [Trichonephila clavipes]
MITNFFIPELNNHYYQELWFQQDCATCHTARATIDLLKDTFGGRLISRFGPVNWPPRSCDLTPLDYFLWGYVKSLVYADKPQTLDHLEDNIRGVIADIRPQMLEKVIENWTSRLDYIRASRGSPMPEIIFKINSLRGYDEEDSNVEEYISEYDSSTEINPDLEKVDTFENKCFVCKEHKNIYEKLNFKGDNRYSSLPDELLKKKSIAGTIGEDKNEIPKFLKRSTEVQKFTLIC